CCDGAFQVLGIKDLECKVVGSTKNYIALTHAFFVEGRLPIIKQEVPFYANLPNHLAAEALKYRFRNRDKCMIRLMADDVVPRWTRDERRKWADQKHQDVMGGLIPLPKGIGLSMIAPKSEEM
ncbi:unnamed protein product, partial [Gongylonema pulchrum]|uniref:DDE-1 domain-containing protein n=1 Tax=Gongylonema pulchrum TaxID=637853 RepID=A0A183EJJ5_9BILA